MYSQTVSLFYRTKSIMVAAILALIATLWALSEGMNRIKVFTLLLLPTMFTLGVGSFYFLLPTRWLTRLPVDALFGLAMYFLLLSQNVFNVASSRTIPLYRAASTATFLFTVLTAWLLYHILHAFGLPFVFNGLASFMISFLLIAPALWAVKMDEFTLEIFIYSLGLSLIQAEIAIALSFWPIPANSMMWSIGLTSSLFVLLGLALDHFRERLGKSEISMYIQTVVVVLLVIFLTTKWTG